MTDFKSSHPYKKWLSTACSALIFFALTLPQAKAIPAQLAVGPDSNLELLLKTVASARRSLEINIYQFDSMVIAQAIEAKIRSGVAVKMLLEGQPATTNRVSPGTLAVVDLLRTAIRETTRPAKPAQASWIRVMEDYAKEGNRRFRYNHAKYIIADERTIFVSSENFSKTGHAATGMVGNRGWDIAIDNPSMVRTFLDLFAMDASLTEGDVTEVELNGPIPLVADRPSPDAPRPTKARTVDPIPVKSLDIASVQLLTAPQAIAPMIQIFRSAKARLDIEQMGITPTWRDENNQRIVNPWLQEFVASAQKGVHVRVLLNDASVFGADAAKGNINTATMLNRAAACYHLPLESKIVSIPNTQITYIHNKGVLVDQDLTLVSSINGTMNSSEGNREVALYVKSAAANQYYSQAFTWDWNQSPKLSAPIPKSTLNGYLVSDCGLDQADGLPVLLQF